MKRIYSLMIIGNLIPFVAFFLINNYIYENPDGVVNSSLITPSIIISYLSIIILIGIAYIYGFAMISNKFRNLELYMYMHMIILLFNIFAMPLFITTMNRKELNIAISAICILSIIFQMLSVNGLQDKEFDIRYERKIFRKIEEKYGPHKRLEKLRKPINRIYIVYFILYIVNPDKYIFAGILMVGTLIITIFLIKIRKEYLKIDYIKNKDIIILFLGHYISAIIATLLYFNGFTQVFWILLVGIFYEDLIKNKIVRRKYFEIEKMMLKDGEL